MTREAAEKIKKDLGLISFVPATEMEVKLWNYCIEKEMERDVGAVLGRKLNELNHKCKKLEQRLAAQKER